MVCQIPEIQLVNFIAVLQLLAGLCLIFFYDDLLKRVAVTPSRSGCINILDYVRNMFDAEVSKEDFEKLYSILDCKRRDDGKWEMIPTLRHVISYCAKLGFVYLAMLMIVASHEVPGDSQPQYPVYYEWLVIATLVYLVLVALALYRRDNPRYSYYWYFVMPSIVIIATICMSCHLPIGIEADKRYCSYIILACIPLAVIILFRVFRYDEHRARNMNRQLIALHRAVSSYNAWAVRESSYYSIDNSIRRLLHPDISEIEARPIVENYIKEKIHEIRESSESLNYLIVNPYRRAEEKIRETLECFRILTVDTLTKILVILYVIGCAYLISKSV